MANVLNPNAVSPPSITFYPKMAEDFIQEQPFLKPSITAFHNIFEGVFERQQLAFLNRFGKLSLEHTSCGANPSGTLTTSEKEWNPKNFKAEVNQCWTAFEQTFMAWKRTQTGVDRLDLTNFDWFVNFLYDFMRDAMLEDVMRMVWLSDTALVAGDLTNGASDLPYYNKIDGFHKQIVASVTAGGANDAKRFTITQNAAANAAAQLTLAADTAYNVYKGLFEVADSRLIGSPNKVIISTRTLVDNYAAYLESKGNDVSFERIEGGFTTLRYRDTLIYNFDLLDRYIQADFLTGSPATYDQPHRAYLTTADNMGVAMDAASAIGNLKGFYDEKAEDYTAKAAYKLDALVLWEYLVAAAY